MKGDQKMKKAALVITISLLVLFFVLSITAMAESLTPSISVTGNAAMTMANAAYESTTSPSTSSVQNYAIIGVEQGRTKIALWQNAVGVQNEATAIEKSAVEVNVITSKRTAIESATRGEIGITQMAVIAQKIAVNPSSAIPTGMVSAVPNSQPIQKSSTMGATGALEVASFCASTRSGDLYSASNMASTYITSLLV